MTPFEDYLLKQKAKNLQPGNKIKYIGKYPLRTYYFDTHSSSPLEIPVIKPNNIYTFLELDEGPDELFIKVKEHSHILIPIKNIVKV